MEKRSTEGHMDYEWQDLSGPVDASSPFIKHAANYQKQQQDQATPQDVTKKRPWSVLDSPSKSKTFPGLRAPTSQSTFLFSAPTSQSPSKPLPPTPVPTNPAFMTPRCKLDMIYDSSEVDANSSPDYNADSDATPDKVGLKAAASKATSALAQVLAPEKGKRNNNNTTANRSLIVAGKANTFHHGVEKRVKKSRSRTGSKWPIKRKESSGSESEDGKHYSPVPQEAKPGFISSMFGLIETHPGIPHILSFYAQLLLNVFLVFFFIYIVYSFWATIRSDVDKRSEQAVLDIMAEMAECARDYQQNGCGLATIPPALESICQSWERCMKKDPRAVGRARVSAHTFAEIFNSFIEPISYKAMIFSFILIFGCVGISNFAFGFFRNKAHIAPTGPPPPAQYVQTPHRSPNGPPDYYWSAYHSPMARQPEVTGTPGALNMPSPVRRLQY